jgi:D-3-phosphoglycerate dehydrogenase / 2-oxoglutarate reductase
METSKTSYPKEKIKVLLLENISDAAVKKFVDSGYVSVEKLTKALLKSLQKHCLKMNSFKK